MLPYLQTMGAATGFWKSLNDQQRTVLNGVVTKLLPPLLLKHTKINENIIALLAADGSLEEKAAQLMANPEAVSALLSSSKESDIPSGIMAFKCPHCQEHFLKELNHGSSSNS